MGEAIEVKQALVRSTRRLMNAPIAERLEVNSQTSPPSTGLATVVLEFYSILEL